MTKSVLKSSLRGQVRKATKHVNAIVHIVQRMSESLVELQRQVTNNSIVMSLLEHKGLITEEEINEERDRLIEKLKAEKDKMVEDGTLRSEDEDTTGEEDPGRDSEHASLEGVVCDEDTR